MASTGGGSNTEVSTAEGKRADAAQKSHNRSRGERGQGASTGGRTRERQSNADGAPQDVRLQPPPQPLIGGSRTQRYQQPQQQPRNNPPQHQHQRRERPGPTREFNPSRKRTKERRDHAGLPFKPGAKQHDCYICCQKSDLFGVGACLHPACLECSIRVRIIGDSRACPVCRAGTDTLFVVEAPSDVGNFRLPEETIPHRDGHLHAIQFATDYAIAAYESYIENKCNVCGERGESAVFDTFAALRQHVQQTHQLTYCRLCVESVNVLPKDRRIYTKEQLERHMNGKESSKDEGFRGHPKCLFCEERYYDEEEQYRHLRREHYFCGLCEADGASHFFYKNAHQLMQHYKRSHHPCNDPECVTAGIVFRNELELSIHRSRQHNIHSGRPLQLTSQLDFRFARNSHQQNSRAREENPPVAAAGEVEAADSPPQERAYQYQIVHSAAAAPSMRIVPSSDPSITVRIVPSANARTLPRSVGRPTAEENYTSQFPGLPAASEQRTPLPYGAPPPGYASSTAQWRAGGLVPTQALRLPAQITTATCPIPISGEQFPSLSNRSSGATGLSSGRNTVWGRGNTADLFTGKPKAPTPKRKPIIPIPDIWPEHIQATLRAREQGLPDPSLPEEHLPAPSTITLSEEEASGQKPKEKKQKKKKSKMASAASVIARDGDQIVPSRTKFESLAELDEEEGESSKGRPKPKAKSAKRTEKNEWVNGTAIEGEVGREVGSAVKLQPTDDGFVKIHLDPTTTRDSPSKTSTSLASIAQRLEQQKNDDGLQGEGDATQSNVEF